MSSSLRLFSVAAALALMVHATVCAIQRARQPPLFPSLTKLTRTRTHLTADRDYLKAVQQPFTYAPIEVRAPARPPAAPH